MILFMLIAVIGLALFASVPTKRHGFSPPARRLSKTDYKLGLNYS